MFFGVSTFDITLVVLILLFTAIGAWRGFVRELVSLITWIVASVTAWMFADRLAGVFEKLTQEGALRQMLAFALIFIVIFIIGILVGLGLHKLVSKSASLRAVNRVTGAALGMARGGVIVVIVFLLAGLTSFPQRPWWRESVLTPPFERAAIYAARYLPRDVARHVRYS